MFDRYVSFAARQSPYMLAASNGREHVSYRALDRAVDGVAGLLANVIRADQPVVALSIRDAYQHALVALACGRLGVPSASLFPDAAVSLAQLVDADILVTDVASTGGWSGASVLADAAWFAEAASSADRKVSPVFVDPAGLARVQLSSGTTGQPRAVDLSWASLAARVSGGFFSDGEAMRRLLTLVGPESGSFQLMLTTWKHRGCVLFAPQTAAAVAAMLPVLQPTSMLASPAQLAALLDALPADAPPVGGMSIAVVGGKLSDALAGRTAVRLGAMVITVYASTEAGTTAIGYAAARPDSAAIGYVMPTSHVDIVDEAGQRLPTGEVGRLRISGAELASGYRGETAGETLGDGYFHPGDLGSLDAAGLLRIVGREDEVMNLGGEKFLPDMLEDKVRPVPGVADVAAFALEDDAGIAQPWLAVVRDGAVGHEAIGAVLDLPGLPPVRIAWIDSIPRTLMGKVRREELRAAARALAG